MTGKVLLFIAGLVFVGVGAVNLVAPQAGMEPLGLKLVTVDSLNEIRANYGGMHLFLGVFLLAAVFKAMLRTPALFLLAFFTGGLVLGRVVSLLVDGVPGNMMWGFMLLETIAFLWASVLIIHQIKGQTPEANG